MGIKPFEIEDYTGRKVAYGYTYAAREMGLQHHCAARSQHHDANKILAMQALWRICKPPLTI